MLRLTVNKGDILEIKRVKAKNTLRLTFNGGGLIQVSTDRELSIETVEEEHYDTKDEES